MRRPAVLVMVLLICLTVPSGAPAAAGEPVAWRAVWSVALDAAAFGATGPITDYSYIVEPSARALAVTAGTGGIVVLDPPTGRLLSTIPPEPGLAEVTRMRFAGGVLVALRWSPDGRYSWGRLTAYDPATGRRLWGGRAAEEAAVSREAVAALTPSSVELLDAGTGETTATMPLQRGCTGKLAAVADVVAVLEICGTQRVRLTTADPTTGRPRWTRDLAYRAPRQWPPPAEPDTTVKAEVAVAADGSVLVDLADDHPRLYAPDGTRLPMETGARPSWDYTSADTSGRPPIIALGGGPAYTVSSGPSGTERIRALDAGTGLLRWTSPGPRTKPPIATGGMLVTDAGEVYSARALDPWPLVGRLLVTDPATGETSDLALPSAGSAATLVGGAGGLIFTRSPPYDESGGLKGAVRLTAYRLVRASLARAPLPAWPDACGVLTDRDLRLLAPGYLADPHARTLAGVRLTKPVGCVWIPPADEGDVVSVSVQWVAPSVPEARRLVEEEVRYGIGQARTGSVQAPDGSRIVYYEIGDPAGTFHAALISTGPVIVKMTALTPESLRHLAPRALANLQGA